MNILRIVPYFHQPEIGVIEKSGFSQTIFELNEVQMVGNHNVFLLSGHRKGYKVNSLEIINPFKHIRIFKSIFFSFLLYLKYSKIFNNLDGDKGFKSLLLNLFKSNSIDPILQKFSIDTIHLHSLDDNVIPYLLKIIELRKKFILTLHFRYPLNKTKYKLLVDIISKSKGQLTVISKALQEDLYKAGYNKDVVVITDGFKKDRSLNTKHPTYNHIFSDKSFNYLLFAGSLTKRKNLIFLIENFNLLPNKTKLIVCGDGYLRNELLSTTKALGLSERIIFLGNIEYSDMPFFYSNADLVCVVSLSEAFGRMFIEAGSFGTPTLCFNDLESISNLEKIKGFFTAPRDRNIFFTKLIEILNLGIDKNRIIDSTKPFEWSNINRNYVELYKKYSLN